MGNPAGVKRDFDALERRRMEAARLLRKGVNPAEVAREVGVNRQSVYRWVEQLDSKGRNGLKKAGRAGRKPRLSEYDLAKLERALERGPEALGYANELWTTGRVAELIEQEFGITYHSAHVWRILRRMGWKVRLFATPDTAYQNLEAIVFGAQGALLDGKFHPPDRLPAERDERVIDELVRVIKTEPAGGRFYLVALDRTHFD